MLRSFPLKLVAVVLGAFIVGTAWIVAATAGRPTPVARAAVTPTPAPVAAATERPTVSVANSTPLPTPAPFVTATFLPTSPPAAAKPTGPSPEARAYMDWAAPKIQVAGQAMSGLSQQSQLASQNPRLLADNDWKIKTAVALAFMKNAGEDMQKYPGQVPPDVKHLDDIMKGLGGDLIYVADEFAGGLDQGSVARINNATTRMNAATQKMKDGTAEAERLNRGGG